MKSTTKMNFLIMVEKIIKQGQLKKLLTYHTIKYL